MDLLMNGKVKVLLGIIIGFILGSVVTWTVTITDPICSTSTATTTIINRGKNTQSEAPIIKRGNHNHKGDRKPLYIAVVTSRTFIKTRARTINSTWGRIGHDIGYYIGERQGARDSIKLPIVSLEGTDDTYPPQRKVYAMYQYLYDNYIDQYDWFMRADDDVYIKVPKLIKFLSKLDPSKPLYIGSPGSGKKKDLKRLKLRPSETYCMGGPGVVLSRTLLQKLAPHLKDCLKNVVVSYNEDVEVGRCISRRLGIQCTKSYKMHSLFYQDYSNGKMMFDRNGRVRSNLGKKTRNKIKNVLTFHPLKSKEKMLSIHKYFVDLSH